MSVLSEYQAALDQGRIKPDHGQETAAKRLQKLADEITAYRPGFFRRSAPPRGLYLWGDVGRGKSMLMDLFFAGAEADAKRRVHFNDFMAEVHALLHVLRRDARLRDPLPAVAKQLEQRILCFDEFQVEDVADAMILGRLFEQLFARGVVIVATSNTAPDRLYQHGLNRQLFLPFIGLIKQRMEVFHLDGNDHRREFSGDRYRSGPGAEAAMDEIWENLGGAHEKHRSLTVLGRTLPVTRAVTGAARFTFHELCEEPLGPSDYLALSEAFHSLVIDAIPVLTERNSAKRFISLIDTLYDRKVRLFCAAAAEPEALYPEGSETFQRTVSRLLEMRSDAYIARVAP